MPRFAAVLASVLFLIASARASDPNPNAGVDFFEKHVRPVLVDRCYTCHSASAKKLKANLLLDTREGTLKGGDTGPAIIPGNVDKSLLITAIRWTDKEMQMPPKEKLPPEQIQAIEQWVKMGAPDPRTAGAVAATQPAFDYEKARKFWSFQPVKAVTPPSDIEAEWAKNPIDAFVREKQKEKGLEPVALADKRILIRRVTLDLTGLLPTPDDVEAFVNDTSADAFEKIVDRLLASPAYGEKWGRHWLDLVRYADTSGCNCDWPVPDAYKYRNYVIDAFNRDKPFDAFVREQIAGDLLPTKTDGDRAQNIIATGYLAIARRFGSRASEYHLTIEDQIDNLGKGLLGMTLGCARCHDHKFDPLPMTDYYGLYGILSSTRTSFPGTEILPHPKDLVPLGTGALADQYRRQTTELAEIDDKVERLTTESRVLAREESDIAKLKAEGKPLPPPKAQPLTIVAAFTSSVTPIGIPRIGVALHSELMAAQVDAGIIGPRTVAVVRQEKAALIARSKELKAHPIQLDTAYAASESDKPANARIQRKGDPRNLGDEAPRGFLAVLGGKKLPADEKGSGRRELAEWIVARDNPLTARVFVNRLWQWHFGKGIVQTPNDFGSRGKAPTHPELLDYLATRFMNGGWSIKAMQKVIVMSRTYQLASEDDDAGRVAKDASIDAANDYLWRFKRRRMEAEEVRDSMLMIAGTLDRRQGAAHPFPPEAERHYSQHRPFVDDHPSKLRTVYTMQQRIRKQPFLEVFDGADTNAATAGRAKESSPVQALFFMNDALAFDCATQFAARLDKASGNDEEKRVDLAYRLCFARPPSSEEIFVAHEYLRDVKEKLKDSPDVRDDQRTPAAWSSYLRVLLASNEFFYVD